MRAEISNQEETLEDLLMMVRSFEQQLVSTANNLTHAIVSTGKIETPFNRPCR